MKPSEFQKGIENEFDYICKRAIRDERKNYFKQLKRLAKHEVTFSMVGDQKVNQFSTSDDHSISSETFSVNGIPITVENEELIEALKKLPSKKREIILLHYFLELSDSEIGEIIQLHRTNVYRNRQAALKTIKQIMEDKHDGK